MSRCIHSEIIDFKGGRVAGKALRTTPMHPNIAVFWQNCLAEGLFDKLFATGTVISTDSLGYMTDFDAEGMTYVVGCFIDPAKPIPAGFDVFEVPPCTLIKTWVEGPIETIFGETHTISEKIAHELGYKEAWQDSFCAEVYSEARFMKSQAEGKNKIILDYLLPIVKN